MADAVVAASSKDRCDRVAADHHQLLRLDLLPGLRRPDLRNIGVHSPGYWIASSRTFNAANEIANDFNPIGVTVGDFNVSEFIFYQNK